MADFMPAADADLRDWLTNYSTQLGGSGTTLGILAPEVALTQGNIAVWNDLHDAVIAAKAALQSAVAEKDTAKTVLKAALRNQISRIKSNAAYTAAIGEAYDVVTEAVAFDPSTFKTTLKAQQEGSTIRIDFVKGQTEGVNVYARLNGQATWTFLARDTASPYVDNRPLPGGTSSEVREFKARGVVGDTEIGLDSDIVTVVYSG